MLEMNGCMETDGYVEMDGCMETNEFICKGLDTIIESDVFIDSVVCLLIKQYVYTREGMLTHHKRMQPIHFSSLFSLFFNGLEAEVSFLYAKKRSRE